MYCTRCGAQTSDGAKFCGKCGNILAVQEAEQQQKDNGEKSTPEEIKKYKGLEGWLTLVILGLFISAGRLGYEFITIFTGDTDYSGVGR